MYEMDHSFSSFEEWMRWANKNDIFCDSTRISDLANRIRRQGFVEPLTGVAVQPHEIVPDGTGKLREGIVAHGRNSRSRAVLHLIEQQLQGRERLFVSIYAPEAVTSMALCLRGLFPRFLGSEYCSTNEQRDQLYPIPHEDLTRLTLRSNAFDLVSTNEVLEHVPGIDAALAEIWRILKPGGWHIGTIPFAFMNETGILRAEVRNGQVEFKREPEYHGNPVGGPSLVFETPAWDILDRAQRVGFSVARMQFVASETHGYLTENMGVFVFCCQK